MASDNLVNYTPEELTELFGAASAEAVQIEAEVLPIEAMEDNIGLLQANEPPQKMSGGAKFGYWFLLFLVFGILALIIGFGSGSPDTVGGFFSLIAFVLPIVIVYFMSKKKKQTHTNWQDQIATLRDQIKEQDAELAQTIQRVANKIMLIPEEYRYSFALDTMQGFLKNFRADNWRDCMNLYEEQKHRWLLEQNNSEGLLLQRQMAQSSERAASSAEAAAFFGAVTAVSTGILAHQAVKRQKS
jgi:hypothetical protein